MARLKDKVALVTGAASGIGAATSTRFIAEGAMVALTDINTDAGSELARELGNKAIFVEHDVAEPDAWSNAIAQTTDAFGGLDILVNNAGIAIGGSIEEHTLEEWQQVMRVNSDAVFLGCKAAVEAMKNPDQRNGRGGSIVNLSSIHGIMAAAYATAYSASKGAVRLLTKAVAVYCGQMGYDIRCNSVHPGYIETPMVTDSIGAQPNAEEMGAMILAHHPLGRLGQPEEVAGAILYLASDEASFVTGSELVIDGGYQLV